jgi:hypothetical protein
MVTKEIILINNFKTLPIELVSKIIMYIPKHPNYEILNSTINYYKEYCNYRDLYFDGKGLGVTSYIKFMLYINDDLYYDYFNIPNEEDY